MNECTKIQMECDQCKERFRRPWKEYHDCRRVYLRRLKEAETKIVYYEEALADKTRRLAEIAAEDGNAGRRTEKKRKLKDKLELQVS